MSPTWCPCTSIPCAICQRVELDHILPVESTHVILSNDFDTKIIGGVSFGNSQSGLLHMSDVQDAIRHNINNSLNITLI